MLFGIYTNKIGDCSFIYLFIYGGTGMGGAGRLGGATWKGKRGGGQGRGQRQRVEEGARGGGFCIWI